MRTCITILWVLLTTALLFGAEKREIVRAKDLDRNVVRTKVYHLIDQLKNDRDRDWLSKLDRDALLAPQAYVVQEMCELLLDVYEREGIGRSMDLLSHCKPVFLDALRCDYTECVAATFGYALLCHQRLDDALRIFAQNVSLHPESWRACESLGEAYAIKGETRPAIEYYERSLEINPLNRGAQQALKRLKAGAGALLSGEPVESPRVLCRH